MSGTTKILVVDDNKEMCCFLGDVVRSEGYEAFEALDAFKALELMEENAFHAAILDIILPDIDGIELMKKLRKIDPDLSPIMITGKGDLEGAVEALTSGAEEYLLKPINVPELKVILNKVITRRRTIEEKRHLQQMLHQSEERYRKSISKMDDAIILVDMVHNRIIDANSKAQQITGYKIQMLLKIGLFDLFPEAVRPELREIVRNIKRRKQDIFSHLSIRRADSSELPIEAHGQLISYKDGKHIQLIFHDISERKEAEEKKWHSQRFTTFSEMANIAKDEVSSPLTAILGQTEVLKSRLNIKNPAVKESLRSIEEQVTKVKNLLDHLHDFAHIQSGSEAPITKRKIRTRRYKTKTAVQRVGSGKRKILIVDDEPAMCQVLEDFFTMNSFDVVTSGDGEEGLKQFKKGNVDLVVTDLTMPRMDGVDLLREIKSSESSVPVILMTGLNLNQVDSIAKKYGADGYIMKPFSFLQMMKLVQELLSKDSVLSVS